MGRTLNYDVMSDILTNNWWIYIKAIIDITCMHKKGLWYIGNLFIDQLLTFSIKCGDTYIVDHTVNKLQNQWN